ncbi:MAG: integrase catalytic domain-containing protein [Terriglobia bacterium]
MHRADMDQEARNQYLRDLREEYAMAGKTAKTAVLDEAVKRTRLARKVIIGKLSHPRTLVPVQRRRRRRSYDSAVGGALVELWELFDFPCGQRLAPLLREQVPRLRQRQQWSCSEEVGAKLLSISPRTIDRILTAERRRLQLPQYRRSGTRRLLLEQIPVKVADQWDRTQLGNLQLDYVAHCGQSTAGSFLWTLSVVDIASNWWEGRALVDRTQWATRRGLDHIRRGLPFRIRELHPDNDSSAINRLVVDYCRQNQIALSRSRPLKKNDNCWIEQKNWTHVRKLVGYHRLSGELQCRLLEELYRVWSLWRNFFQPVMRLKSKIREGSKVHRQYDTAKTPYQRLWDSKQLSAPSRESLQRQYDALNPIELMHQIQTRQDQLLRLIRKPQISASSPRRLSPRLVTSFVTQQPRVRLPR